MNREELINDLLSVDNTWSRAEATEAIDWHLENKHVWRAFEAEAIRIVHSGITHWSSKTIWEYLRHETAIKEKTDRMFKLNNNRTALMSRLWAVKYKNTPWADLFELRKAA